MTSSLYGCDLQEFIAGFENHMGFAHELAVYVAGHGGRYPAERIASTLGLCDRAAFELLGSYPELPVIAKPPAASGDGVTLALSINTLGRLHIRPVAAVLPRYTDDDEWQTVGYVGLSPAQHGELGDRVAAARSAEAAALRKVQRAMDVVHAAGELGRVLEQVIDHVQHVESVCFYVGDRFYARIDRYVNLIDTKSSTGHLTALRGKDYLQWSDDEICIVAALHALFTAGKAVKFEEFNGCTLSARALLDRLGGILARYRWVGATAMDGSADLMVLAAEIHRVATSSVAKPWLRYRWIYGPTFQKTEELLPAPSSTEARTAHLEDFEDLYRELERGRDLHGVPESLFFTQLATACLSRDVAGVPCNRGSAAAGGWVEYLMERIVASAVRATDSDYGMSSSLRDLSRFVEYDRAALLASVHALTPADFYTCFVSRNFASYDKAVADTIAGSVQARMMFNRWHFFPGNFERAAVREDRHWYYPPLVPDIAIFSNVHRAGHSRAQVKYSIRAPGPDMSRPALQIADHPYRGFYDIRVVRMDGDRGYTVEDMLRARRRTLWLESVFAVLVAHVQSASPAPFTIRGFQRGVYLDLPGDAVKAA